MSSRGLRAGPLASWGAVCCLCGCACCACCAGRPAPAAAARLLPHPAAPPPSHPDPAPRTRPSHAHTGQHWAEIRALQDKARQEGTGPRYNERQRNMVEGGKKGAEYWERQLLELEQLLPQLQQQHQQRPQLKLEQQLLQLQQLRQLLLLQQHQHQQQHQQQQRPPELQLGVPDGGGGGGFPMLPARCSLLAPGPCILLGRGDAMAVQYRSEDTGRAGSVVWDGAAWHDLGTYSSEADARQAARAMLELAGALRGGLLGAGAGLMV
jgi:hypothetical protein